MASASETAQREIAEALTEGLLAGFAGGTSFTTVKRGIFPIQSSGVKTHNINYEDQWLKSRTGGGQELVKVGTRQFTRLYAGGVIELEKLEEFGITEIDVTTFLKSVLQEQRTNVRLFENCKAIVRGDWSYSYEIVSESSSVALVIAKETINFKSTEVFVHAFLLCPVK
jgi:hypothetical protein